MLIENEYGNINNDMKMESTIYNTVEQAKLDLKRIINILMKIISFNQLFM